MRKVFVALAFIAIIVSAALLPEAQQKISSSISKLHKSKIGKNIITAIQLEMSSQNKENIVVRILALLNELLTEQVDQEATAVQDLAKRSDDCDSARLNYEGQITQKEADIVGAEVKVPQIESQIAADETSKISEETKHQNATDGLDSANDQNDDAVAAFEKSQKNHNAMIDALKQARELIVQLQSTSFLQKNDVVLAQIQTHNKISMKALSGHQSRGIFELLMQMAQDVGIQADQALVGSVVEVIDDLLNYEQEGVSSESAAENQRHAEYTSAVHDFEEKIQNAAAEIVRLTAEIEQAVNELNETKNNINQWKDQHVELLDLLHNHNEQCDSDIAHYHEQIDELNEQIDTIREVIVIFESNDIQDIKPNVENLEF